MLRQEKHKLRCLKTTFSFSSDTEAFNEGSYHSVLVMNNVYLHLTEYELGFCVDRDPACKVLEVGNDEKF